MPMSNIFKYFRKYNKFIIYATQPIVKLLNIQIGNLKKKNLVKKFQKNQN